MTLQLPQNLDQLIHRRPIGWIVAGIDEAQDTVFVHDEVAAELGSVVAMRVEELAALKPTFDIHPHDARMSRTQA